jgi:hypothetical protein
MGWVYFKSEDPQRSCAARRRRRARLHTVARSRETSNQKRKAAKKMNPRAAAPGGSYL